MLRGPILLLNETLIAILLQLPPQPVQGGLGGQGFDFRLP